MDLEEILEIIFYRTAAVFSAKAYPPTREEVLEVVQPMANTMREMKLTILPDNLLKENNENTN